MQSIPRHPIVDTGPLFDYLLWRFSCSDYFKGAARSFQFRYLKTDSYREAVRWYFTRAKPITTCPQVIAEIHRHGEKQLRAPNLGYFWRFAQQELAELSLNEKLVTLAQMDGNILSSFGPTDTALLQLAGASSHSSQPVFTEEGELAGKCREREVKVLRIAEVLSIWQEYERKG